MPDRPDQNGERRDANGGGRSSLSGSGISVSFEGVRALHEVDVSVQQGDLFGLMGPNGAGKTTLVNVLSGLIPADSGEVHLDGVAVTRWPLWKRARHGISRSFQGTRLFPNLSVRENLEAAALGCGQGVGEAKTTADALLDRTNLEARADQPAASLSAGDQQRVGVLRALATRPSFLLLDEPAAGLNEVESEALVRSLRDLRETVGCGVLLIEHDMSVMMTLCERIQVLNHGETIAEGTRDEIRRDPDVIEAYLGIGVADA